MPFIARLHDGRRMEDNIVSPRRVHPEFDLPGKNVDRVLVFPT